ncbi:checkpoint protein Hus1/Mec3 [Radiomyces spectabilis]|uniref:checkpoint protein Hus1/Mec3 n=1 Tax=Radiomyces spectabilis TaxID=64574 RepID=UPI00221ED36D|nr:checkpoint protein Hus1/Mec3 [Radiomyces spectabilis]KAI8391618.1 checkpoint protein Hus1/Mec3 [Radiomyces spectabilis]
MKFRTTVNNPVGLFKIAQTLEKLGPSCIVSFSMDTVRFIKYREFDGGIQAWIKVNPPSLFSSYRIESSYNNEINMVIQVDALLRASKAPQQATDIRLQLRRKGNQPILDWQMTSENRAGSTGSMGQEISVKILPPQQMNAIREPTVLATPHAYILMPSLHALKPVADRLKSLGKFVTISANMSGVFKLSMDTDLARCESVYKQLENPRLEGHESTWEPDRFASVRIATEDFVHFLTSYHLEPENVICAITDELQVAFYVYVNLDAYQTQDIQIRPIQGAQTIITYHLPVYYE